MTKFTEGPWNYDLNVSVIYGFRRYGKFEQTIKGAEFEGCSSNNLYEVCTINSLHVYGNNPSKEIIKRVKEMADANARLISKAPEMLELLKTIAEQLRMEILSRYHTEEELESLNRYDCLIKEIEDE